jgi:calcium-dependent protein kinase
MDKRRGIHYLFGNFKDFYEEGKLLGQGTSSVVKKAVCKRTGNQFAIKTTKTRDAERISTIK